MEDMEGQANDESLNLLHFLSSYFSTYTQRNNSKHKNWGRLTYYPLSYPCIPGGKVILFISGQNLLAFYTRATFQVKSDRTFKVLFPVTIFFSKKVQCHIYQSNWYIQHFNKSSFLTVFLEVLQLELIQSVYSLI